MSVVLQMHLSEAAVHALRRVKQELLPCWLVLLFKVDACLLTLITHQSGEHAAGTQYQAGTAVCCCVLWCD